MSPTEQPTCKKHRDGYHDEKHHVGSHRRKIRIILGFWRVLVVGIHFGSDALSWKKRPGGAGGMGAGPAGVNQPRQSARIWQSLQSIAVCYYFLDSIQKYCAEALAHSFINTGYFRQNSRRVLPLSRQQQICRGTSRGNCELPRHLRRLRQNHRPWYHPFGGQSDVARSLGNSRTPWYADGFIPPKGDLPNQFP